MMVQPQVPVAKKEERKTSVKALRGTWESRASTGGIGVKTLKKINPAKKIISGTRTVTNATIGVTKAVAKGTISATKTVAGATIDGTKFVANTTLGATKTVAKGTVGGTKFVAKSTINGTKSATKSARQAIEDVAVFASPRVVQQKLHVNRKKKIVVPAAFLGCEEEKAEEEETKEKNNKKDSPTMKKAPSGPKPMSIAERRRAYEERARALNERAKKFDIMPNAPGTSPIKMHGKRTSKLDRFTPKTGRYIVQSNEKVLPKAPFRQHSIQSDITPGSSSQDTKTTMTKEISNQASLKPVDKAEQTLPPTSVISSSSSSDPTEVAPIAPPQEDDVMPVTTELEASKTAIEGSPEDEAHDIKMTTINEISHQSSLVLVDKAEDKAEQTISPTSVVSCVSSSSSSDPTEAAPIAPPQEDDVMLVTAEPEAPKTAIEGTLEDEAQEQENGKEDTPTASEAPASNEKKDSKASKSRIDRKGVILEEIEEIIRAAEETEIYDEIDEETVEILKESALKSAAYTKRWYDACTDSFIHCPSLAQTIVDYTLLEIAEEKFQELYDEEFPMLYTVGLRGVACNIVGGEEEIPDYIYDLAS